VNDVPFKNCVKGCCPRINDTAVTKAEYDEARKGYPAIQSHGRNEIDEIITDCLKKNSN